MFRVIAPETPVQFSSIFALRFAVLRAQWNQPKGSECDQAEDSSIHAMIEDEGGKCIATGRLQINSPEEAQIRFMAVDPIWRGKRLGQMILDYLESKAREKNCNQIVLQARENAVGFYQGLGYEVVEKSFLLFDEIQHFKMTKSLI